MNRIFSFYLALNGIFILSACGQTTKNKSMNLKTEIDSVSYSLGVNIATNLKNQGFEDINVDILNQAMQDVYKNNEVKIKPEQGQMFLNQYMMKKQQAEGQASAQKGKEFLEKNKKEEG